MTNKLDEIRTKCHLNAYDMLKSLATWLEDPDNEVFSLLEDDGDSLHVVAEASVLAAALLKKAALDIQIVSGIEDTNKYESDITDALSNLQTLANELDSSKDPELMKKASVIDEILLTMASSVEEQRAFKKNMESKIADIKRKADETKKEKSEEGKKKASIDDTDGKEYRPLQTALSTRSFPGAPGDMMARLRDDVWYNINTGEQVDYKEGYMLDGKKVPGTSVDNQTSSLLDVSIPNQFK